ncbi:MAG: dihydrolipoamide acetyltransferase family protein [Kineosporiaceae bacterium]
MAEFEVFRLPDVGEGLTEADIVSWRVAAGAVVDVNDVLVEIETAKSLVELPSPFAGVVRALLVPEGVTVAVGTPIIAIAAVADGADGPTLDVTDVTDVTDAAVEAPVAPEAPVVGHGQEQREPVLVGYGPRESAPTRRRRVAPGAHADRVPATPANGVASHAVPAQASNGSGPVLAKPPVRLLARQLGVDLAAVTPTGENGVVTRQDVERRAAEAGPVLPVTPTPGSSVPEVSRAAIGTAVAAALAGEIDVAAPDGAFPADAREIRIPVRGVRKATADAMVASAFTAPHATEWVTIDVTRSVKLLRRLKADPAFSEVTVSPLLLAARAVVLAAARHPALNATWDGDAGTNGEIVLKRYVNLGIAAATPRGLLVPVIRDAQAMTLVELAQAIMTVARAARAGTTQPADLVGSTFTITNVGVFGMDGGTPILNPGEAAILCLGQVVERPWVHKGKVKPRWTTQLSMSFDHRIVDGEQGSKFLRDVAAVLEDPAKGLFWG